MKKLLIFLILLVVGAALFAMPAVNEGGGLSDEHMTEAVTQQADVLTVMSDVYPAIMLGENLYIFEKTFVVFGINDYLFTIPNLDVCLYRQEVNPYLGCSKTAAYKMKIFV